MKRTKMTRGLGMVVLLLVAIAFQVACTREHAKDQKPANGLFPLKTITMKDCSLAPWLVAERNGYFKDEKIQIVYTGETQQALIIPSILNGDNDVSGAHPNTLAVAKASGAKITGVVRGVIDPPGACQRV